MKQRELFVGAIVCAESPSGICEVKEILSDHWIDTEGIRHDYERTEPIPLTPEILEKNGFEYCEAHRMYLYLDDFFDIKIRQYSDMMWEFTYCNNEINLPDTRIAGIGYVHHLQHALNMVGVEKDIII